MRVSRIEFKGFRRLADAATNIDGDLVAIVGFNEAGKTSMLDALRWFSTGSELAVTDRNRTQPPASESQQVVKVFFELDAKDRELIADIPCDQAPTSIVLGRKQDGGQVCSLTPYPRRPSKPFADATARLETAKNAGVFQTPHDEHDEEEWPSPWLAELADLLEPEEDWSDAQRALLGRLVSWCSEAPVGRKAPRDQKLATLLEDVAELVARPSPAKEMWDRLRSRVPDFVMFTEDRKVIKTSYDLNPQHRALDPSVVDLLGIADVSPDALWTHVSNSDTSNLETLIERGNERLSDLFKAAWNQSGVTVRLKVDGTRLLILVRELREGGAVTHIAERSDGLRAFVALAAFLAADPHDAPPVLLIDEAETHLHYDAQADLVGVLLKSLDTTQVIYTTHSPGCLPSDLGTGIRVVARDTRRGDASIIRHDFWHGEGPGFSPLLFAMGAGAAAFSMCRKAVLGEGASEMILLPTLIRLATRLDDLDYQVAQGLANAHTSGIRVEEVAAKVVYLVDGDEGGAAHVAQLVGAGVDRKRVFALPTGYAIEDLIEPEDYIAIVNGLLDRIGRSPERFAQSDVVAGQPIAKSFTDWAKVRRVQAPGKIEIAYALLRRDNGHLPFRLTPSGKRALESLHKRFEAAFEAQPMSAAD